MAAGCSLTAATLAFGPYAGVQLDATSTITVICTRTTSYDVGLSDGLYFGASSRRMNGPTASRLPYQLYRNSLRTQLWGTTIGSNTVSGVGSGASQMLTVYGRITNNQFKNPGAYTDTVTVTVTY